MRLALLTAFLLSAPLLAAETVVPIPTDAAAGVTIKIASPCTSVPHFGFMPVRVAIDNQARTEGTWDFRFEAGARGAFPGLGVSQYRVTVPAGQNRETWIYIPLPAPGVNVNAPAILGGGSTSSPGLPSAPPPVPGVYPNPQLQGVSFRMRTSVTSAPSGLVRVFTITQQGPAGLLPQLSESQLPPRATCAVTAPDSSGRATRTTTIQVEVGRGSGSGPASLPSLVASNNARQLLERAGLHNATFRSSSSVTTKPGTRPNSTEVTVTFRQTGPIAELPAIPPSALPSGFTSVNVAPDANGATATREFTYVETVALSAGSGTTAAPQVLPRNTGSGAAAEAEARTLLAPTKLLETPPGATTTVTVEAIVYGPLSTPMVAFEHKGAAAFPNPSSKLPPGVRVVTLSDGTTGTQRRVITVVDPSVVGAAFGAASAVANTPAGVAQVRQLAQHELGRSGVYRPQTGVSQSSSTRSSPGVAPTTPDILVFSESGPAAQLPAVPSSALPPGIACTVSPGPLPGEVSRNFVVTVPAFLAGGAPAVAGGAPGSPGGVRFSTGTMSVASTLLIDPAGPGIAPGLRLSFPNAIGTTPMAPLATTPALAGTLGGKLGAAGMRGQPNVCAVELTAMPADWRAWSSFSAVVVGNEDYDTLDGARRAALRSWIATGGLLFLVPDAAGDARTEPLGAGRIITLAEPLNDTTTSALVSRLQLTSASPALPEMEQVYVLPSSRMGALVKFEPVSTAWIALFLMGFAVLVGPVNLFLLAPARRRHRLFFSTPALSVLGAAAVAATIIIQDGFGGEGERRALVNFVPGENQAVVYQEQGARTGFLTRRHFGLEDSIALSMLPPEASATMHRGSPHVLNRVEGEAAGDWFRNRARQAHALRQIAPTRARIEVVALSPAGMPIVESTLTTTLVDFRLRDDAGTFWRAPAVPTGRRVALERELDPPDATIEPNGSQYLTTLIRETRQLKSAWQWSATGGATELAPIATLASIAWRDDPVFYAGVAVASAVAKPEATK